MFLLPVNLLAVFVCALLSMGIGFLWYSPILFGKPWMQLSKIDPKKMAKANANMPKLYSLSFLFTLVMIFALAQLVNLTLMTTALEGAILGVMVWLGFIAATSVNMVLFEQKSWWLFFINTGYHLICLVISGIILTMWI